MAFTLRGEDNGLIELTPLRRKPPFRGGGDKDDPTPLSPGEGGLGRGGEALTLGGDPGPPHSCA